MKARFRYRFYPTDQQRLSLAQLFGCVRVVWNDALALCKQSQKKPSSVELQKVVITQAKKTEERVWLGEVSNIPLQQSVADLDIAFQNFFNSCKGKRKGVQVGYPKFKKRTSSQSARFRIGGFSFKGNGVYLAKIGIVNPIWSRNLPIAKLHNRIADTRKDFLHKLSTKIVNENQVIVLEDLNVSGMVKNRKLARAISQQGWYEFRTLCEAKSQKFGREFKVISRWEPTSQVCSDCGFKWGKIDLSIRSVLCLSCGTEQDRDENAAKNIEQVGMGNRHDSKWAQRESQTTLM
jgi:IS605 OrfB family transposase